MGVLKEIVMATFRFCFSCSLCTYRGCSDVGLFYVYSACSYFSRIGGAVLLFLLLFSSYSITNIPFIYCFCAFAPVCYCPLMRVFFVFILSAHGSFIFQLQSRQQRMLIAFSEL